MEDRTLSCREIAEALEPYGLIVTVDLAERVSRYIELLLRWNQKMNLTSVKEPREILKRHFGESLFGGKAAGIERGVLLDVGSGGGFPAIPILMAQAQVKAVLLEPNLKKVTFLKESCRALELEGRITVERDRLEAYAGGTARRFEWVTSRAVRVGKPFLRNAASVLRSSGRLVLWSGEVSSRELRNSADWQWSEAVSILGSDRRVIVWGSLKRVKLDSSNNAVSGKRST